MSPRPAALVVLLLLLPAAGLPAAPVGELGTPLVRNYGYREYGGHPQNWAAVQDPRGVMYFGNSNGVLEFDGALWRRIEVANHSIVRSLAVDRRGTVWVGAVGELGFLRPDGQGRPVYQSLVGALAAGDRDFADVWRTFALADGVFFWTGDRLLRWHDERFRVWDLDDSFLIPAAIDGRFYVNRRGVGLVTLVGDDFEPVRGGETLADVRVDVLLPRDAGSLLVGSRDGRLYELSLPADRSPPDRPGLAPFAPAAADLLATHQLYVGTGLPRGYALGTMTGGALVLDRDGAPRYHLDRAAGLIDESVWAMTVDRQGGLWLGLNRGLARAEVASPLTVFGERAGIDGTVEVLGRHRGALYAGTSLGLFRLEDGRFTAVAGVPGPCWSLLSDGDRGLLVGATDGVYALRDGAPTRLRATRNAFRLYRPRRDPATVLVGEAGGLAALRLRGGRWRDRGRVGGVDDEIRSLAEDDAGRLWLGTHFEGLLRLEIDFGDPITVRDARRFGLADGLPVLRSLKLHPHGDRLLVATSEGLWRYLPAGERFEPATLLEPPVAGRVDGITRLAADEAGNLWLIRPDQGGPVLATRRADGGYELDDRALRRLPRAEWYALLPEPGGVTWFGGTDGVYRFDATAAALAAAAAPGFDVLIRSVVRGDGTVLFGGLARTAEAEAPFAYRDNSLVFRFAAPVFDAHERTVYRYRLEGYEESWSGWSGDAKKEYTNLPEGDYRFLVEARDVYGTIGERASYRFRVLPPWYRAPLFRLLILATVALLLWGAHRRLVARNLRLERQAAERQSVAEREGLIAQLEAKNAELERFTYTVSHDLKAPLVTIRGFLGFLRRDLAAGDAGSLERDLERIDAAAAKMYILLEELLALSRVGRQAYRLETIPFAEVVAEAQELVAGPITERGAEVAVAPDLPAVTGDRARLVEVMQNLLQNAVKYSGDEPSPRIEVGCRRDGAETVFYVRDNGAGIEPQYHDKVFDLFERLDASTEGSGVGLALVKRIVELHGGRIWIESAGLGHGSTFCFTLPLAAETDSTVL